MCVNVRCTAPCRVCMCVSVRCTAPWSVWMCATRGVLPSKVFAYVCNVRLLHSKVFARWDACMCVQCEVYCILRCLHMRAVWGYYIQRVYICVLFEVTTSSVSTYARSLRLLHPVCLHMRAVWGYYIQRVYICVQCDVHDTHMCLHMRAMWCVFYPYVPAYVCNVMWTVP